VGSNELATVVARVAEARRRELQNAKRGSSIGIARAIEAIHTAYHRDWETQKLDRARALHARISRGVPVATLSVCGHGTAETRYTKYLAYVLDHNKPHGLGTRYLDAVLSLLRQTNPQIPGDIDTSQPREGSAGNRSRRIHRGYAGYLGD
jgi:hypothetical protein